jgi:hypothetical protein
MVTWVVVSNYFNNMFFGTYSSVLNARKAIEHFIIEDDEMVSYMEEDDGYRYTITTKDGKAYWMEILYDIMDADCGKDE